MREAATTREMRMADAPLSPASASDAAPEPEPRRAGWVAGLRRFVRGPARIPTCELCSTPTGEPHAHLVEISEGSLICCCRACALLFGDRESGRYRRVPEAAVALDGFQLADDVWAALAIPVDVAFFYVSSKERRVLVCYPGPAGATRSLLDLAAWQQLVDANPILAELAPDAEALLVNRVEGAHDSYRVPIDQCYALVGLLKLRWRGPSGGATAWHALDDFFARLKRGEPVMRQLGHD